jgi:hypothetical protein
MLIFKCSKNIYISMYVCMFFLLNALTVEDSIKSVNLKINSNLSAPEGNILRVQAIC